MVVAHIEKAVVVEMVVDIVIQNRKGDAPPEFVNVLLSRRAVDADDIDDFGIGVMFESSTLMPSMVAAEQYGMRPPPGRRSKRRTTATGSPSL